MIVKKETTKSRQQNCVHAMELHTNGSACDHGSSNYPHIGSINNPVSISVYYFPFQNVFRTDALPFYQTWAFPTVL